MSTIRPTRRISRKERLREDTVATFYARALAFFDTNKRLVYGATVGVLVLLAALAGFSYLRAQNERSAADAIAAAVRSYEAGLHREALDGVTGNKGLLAVADEYGSTRTGNLSRFYAADALYRLGEYDEALEYFRAYKKDSDYIGASALAGEANILQIQGKSAEAGRLYEQAARLHEDAEFSPRYLMDAGRAYESAGDYARAVQTYQRVEKEYPDAQVAAEAEFYIARASARIVG